MPRARPRLNPLVVCRTGGPYPARRARGRRPPIATILRPMRSRRVAICACLLAAVLAVGGCGDGGGGGSEGEEVTSRPAPPKSAFPAAEGKTLGEVIEEASGPADLVISPASMVFYKGENRYSFGVFEKDRSQVPDAEVALYFARV